MSDTTPIVEWRFPGDDEEDAKTFSTVGPIPRVGEAVNVYRRITVAGKGQEAKDERYVVERVEWSVFDKRDDTATMGTRLDVFAIVILRAVDT
jgi:hypothetical protein